MVFGTVEKRFSWAAGDWTKITNDSIYHIEEDEKDPGKLLFCTESLIGSISQHFRIETVSTETYKIVGFAQHRDRRILIVDRDNGCVRSLSREAKAKQDWFGGCKNPGSYVRQNSVLLVRPFYIIVNLDIGFISDQNTVVVVDMENETVLKTILNTEESQVKIMAFSFDNDVVFLSGKLYLKRYNISETTTTIIHSDDPSSKSPGDGNFEMAKFKSIKSITSISTNILVISDRADSRLRILNLKTNSTSSICNSKVKDKNGDIKNCQLNKPSVLYYQRSIATLWIVTKNNLMSISIAPNKQVDVNSTTVTADSNTDEGEDESGIPNVVTIVLAALGGVILIGSIITGVFVYRLKKRQRRNRVIQKQSGDGKKLDEKQKKVIQAMGDARRNLVKPYRHKPYY